MTYDSDSSAGCGTAETGVGYSCTVTVYYLIDHCEAEADKELERRKDLFLSIIRWLENRFGMVFGKFWLWPVLLYYKIEDGYFLNEILFDKTPKQKSSGYG